MNEVIDMTNENGDTSLKLAIQHNAGAAVGLLVFYGAKDPGDNAKKLLRNSIRLGSFPAIQAATDINATDGDYGRTSLHWAVWRGSLPALKLLRERNAKDNMRDNDGLAALHLASASGHDASVQLLIDKFAADKNAKTKDGTTPLHLACAGGHDSTVQLLVERFAADMYAETSDGITPLDLARDLARAGGHDSTKHLLEKLAADKIKSVLENHIGMERGGLKSRFFKGVLDISHIDQATEMVTKLRAKQCSQELALSLSLLVLYDLVILIG